MSAFTGTAIGALPAMLMDRGNNSVSPGAASGYSANNSALLSLLGGKLNGGAGVSGGQIAAGLTAPLFANTKPNSTALQDIARAMSMGQPISDHSWAQAGLPAGGGDTAQKLHEAIFGAPTPAPAASPIGGAMTGPTPVASNPYIGGGALPIPARDPRSLVAPLRSQTMRPDISGALSRLNNNGASGANFAIPRSSFSQIYAGSR